MTDNSFQPMDFSLNNGSAVRTQRTAEGCAISETHVYFDACEEGKEIRLADMDASGDARILDVHMTLKNVCPARRTAVGVSVYEVDRGGGEHARGFRAVTVPAHIGPGCRDVEMPTLRFVLPENLRLDDCAGGSGGVRHFVLRAALHPIDTGVEL